MENKSYFKYILIGFLIIGITIRLFVYFNNFNSHEKPLNLTKNKTDESKEEKHFDDVAPVKKEEKNETPIKIKQKITQPEFDKLYFSDKELFDLYKELEEAKNIDPELVPEWVSAHKIEFYIDSTKRIKESNISFYESMISQKKILTLRLLLFEYDIDKDEISKSTIFEKKEVSQQEFDKMFQDLCKENETSYEYWSEKQIADSKEHNLKVLLFQYKIIS